MSQLVFSIKLNSRLVEPARQMHLVSRMGEQRNAPNASFECFLSDLVTVAIIERIRPASVTEVTGSPPANGTMLAG